MIKKILTFALFALAITRVNADTVTSDDGYITYTTSGEPTVTNEGTQGRKKTVGDITVTTSKVTYIKTVTTPVTGYTIRTNVIPSSVSSFAASLNFSTFKSNLTQDVNETNRYTTGTKFTSAAINTNNGSIKDEELYGYYSEACAAAEAYDVYSGDFVIESGIEKDIKGNPILETYYYFVDTDEGTAQKIASFSYTLVEQETIDGIGYYDVTSLPANIINENISSITLSSTITTINSEAFKNASNELVSITGAGKYVVNNGALYEYTGGNPTRLIYVMQSAVNNGIFTVPAAVTSIDPYAFKNVENSTIFLNNKVTSYTGTSGNGNTFIGNTLNSGSITDNMLTSGAYEVPNNITTIKEGAFCSTLTSVTIPSTVTKIEAGAFKNCTNLQVITLRSGSTYKLIDNMLINQNHNIIVVTKNVPKNISFQDYVSQVGAYISKVYDYAFKNVTGVTVSSNKDFNVDETKQGTGNTFIMPDVDLHREANVITGNVTRENFSKLAFNAGWCYDLRDANILEPLDADFFAQHVPHNCLLFFGEVNNNGNMVAGDNIVWAEKTTGGKTVYRSNHVIMYDDAPYHNDIAEVECVQADMYRTYKSRQWATIYVPIDFTGITSNTWVGDFDKYDPTTKSLHFKVVENVTHNRPYVLFNNLEIDVPVLGKPNVTLFMSTEDAQPVTWNNMVFTGDYDEWKVTTQTNIYGYTSSGKFAHATTGATFKPFRAWFADNNTYSNGNELHAIFEDEEGNEINLGSASGIEEIGEPEFEGGIYNLNGTKVNDMKNPGLYIQNGKIIIIK